MNTKKNKFSWLYFALVLFLGLMLVFAFVDIGPKIEEIAPSQAIELVNTGNVKELYAYDGEARILLISGKSGITDVKKFPNQADFRFKYTTQTLEEILSAINDFNKTASTDAKIVWSNPPTQPSWIDTLMPILYIALGLFLVYFIFKMFTKQNSSAMQFGKNKARMAQNIKVRFNDIAGADEEKEELQEVVEFLKNPKKFTDLGARIPKGILLVGNPGTGKTLLARAVAGESNVPFLSISGSDFVEMFVGVGASRVRDLFDQAKKSQPCIVFIDEIDAVGRQRGAGLGGGNDEREQTLNQLLVEMDGFETNDQIIVMAATNRADVLDPALLRPGRFDRQIYVHVPDVRGREGIIKIHAKNKPIADDVDYKTLARITSGFTGADIENMLNEAAIIAARQHRTKIIMQDITEGINKVIMGPQKKSLLMTDKDKLITAYHESGHAVIGKVLKNCEDVQEVSIVPRGNAAGYTMSRPDNDDNHMGKNKLNDTIAMMMGGRLSEELFMEDISTGASNDIKRATDTARKMVTDWGMSEQFGFMSFGSEEEIFVGRDYQSKHDYSEDTQTKIDNEVKAILDYNYGRAKKILQENKQIVENMAQLLLQKETIYKEEVDMIMSGKSNYEIIAFMDEQEKKRKEVDKQTRIVGEKEKKIKEIEVRVKTAEMYLKNGIISQRDYDLILKEKENALKKIEESQDDSIENTDNKEFLQNSEEPIKISDEKKQDNLEGEKIEEKQESAELKEEVESFDKNQKKDIVENSAKKDLSSSDEKSTKTRTKKSTKDVKEKKDGKKD